MSSERARVPQQDIVFVLKNPHVAGSLGHLLAVIGETGALIGDIKTRFVGKDSSIREITLSVYDQDHCREVEQAIRERSRAEIIEISDLVFERHEGGKIRSGRTGELEKHDDLRYIYTPGVARVCTAIEQEPALAQKYTSIGNSVGIFTNGTRVLGLGDIGPVASMPAGVNRTFSEQFPKSRIRMSACINSGRSDSQ